MISAEHVVATSWWSRHGAHAVLLGGPAVAMAGFAAITDLRHKLRNRQNERGHRRVSLPLPGRLALVFSVGAAAVHAKVCPEHFREAVIYGLFFMVAASSQLGWVLLTLTRPRRWLIWGGLLGNAAVVALWAWTRTVGDFAGPERGATEEIGPLDIFATVCEVGVVLCTLWWLLSLNRRAVGRRELAATH